MHGLDRLTLQAVPAPADIGDEAFQRFAHLNVSHFLSMRLLIRTCVSTSKAVPSAVRSRPRITCRAMPIACSVVWRCCGSLQLCDEDQDWLSLKRLGFTG